MRLQFIKRTIDSVIVREGFADTVSNLSDNQRNPSLTLQRQLPAAHPRQHQLPPSAQRSVNTCANDNTPLQPGASQRPLRRIRTSLQLTTWRRFPGEHRSAPSPKKDFGDLQRNLQRYDKLWWRLSRRIRPSPLHPRHPRRRAYPKSSNSPLGG